MINIVWGGQNYRQCVAYFCVTILEENIGVALRLPRSAASVKTFSTKLPDCRQQKAGRMHAKLQALTMSLQGKRNDS